MFCAPSNLKRPEHQHIGHRLLRLILLNIIISFFTQTHCRVANLFNYFIINSCFLWRALLTIFSFISWNEIERLFSLTLCFHSRHFHFHFRVSARWSQVCSALNKIANVYCLQRQWPAWTNSHENKKNKTKTAIASGICVALSITSTTFFSSVLFTSWPWSWLTDWIKENYFRRRLTKTIYQNRKSFNKIFFFFLLCFDQNFFRILRRESSLLFSRQIFCFS